MTNEIRFKLDLKQAIANNGKNYETIYDHLIFEGEEKEFCKTLLYMDNLKINIEDNRLVFNVKISKKILNSLSNEDKEELKKMDFEIRLQDFLLQKTMHDVFKGTAKIMENDISFTENFLDNYEDEEEEYRKAEEDEKLKMVRIKRRLKEITGIEFELINSKAYLFLAANVDSINFNEDTLFELVKITKQIDNFSIVPYFDEDLKDDKIKKIRLFFGIDLVE